MAADILAECEGSGRSLFVSGFFSNLFRQGRQPEYGYPKNHLPESVITEMSVTTGFVAALNKAQS